MDIRISKTISTIHFLLITFIIFITLLSISTFIALQYGIVLKQLNFSNLHINRLNLHLNQGLELRIDDITIDKTNIKSDDEAFDYEKVVKKIHSLETILPLFHSIKINNMRMKDLLLQAAYQKNEPLVLSLQNSELSFDVSISNTQEYLYFHDLNLSTSDRVLHVSGGGALDKHDNTTYLKLKSSICDADQQEIYLLSDHQALHFNTLFLTPISKLNEIVALARLHKNIRPWIVTYPQGDVPHLVTLRGTMPYADPKQIVTTLYAEGYWENVAYTFKQGFEPALSKHVDVTFKNGILDIMPRDAYFYSHKGGNTTIAIDFKPKEPILSVHVDTTTQLDEHLLNLIRAYHIDIPLKQSEGLTKADLKLFVNLETNRVNASGDFDLFESRVQFHGVTYKIHSGKVKIKDSDVSLIDINTSYQSYANGILNAEIQAAKNRGIFDIDLYRVTLLDNPKLALAQKPLHVRYHLIPHHLDTIEIASSIWNADSSALHVKAIRADFDYNALQMYLPTTQLHIPGAVEASVQGSIDIKKEHYDLNLTLSKFDLYHLKLNQKALHVSLEYDENLSLVSDQHSSWMYTSLPLELETFKALISKNRLTIDEASFVLNHDLQSDIKGAIDFNRSKGSFELKNIAVNSEKLGEILSHKASMPLELSFKEKEIDISLPVLDFSLLTFEEGWEIQIPDISQLEPYSIVMQDFNISKGSLHIGQTTQSKALYFAGMIDYAYPFLIQNDQANYHYDFYGSYENNITLLTINNDVNVSITDTVALTCNDAGLNLSAFVNFLHDHNRSESNNSTPFTLDATNSFIYFSPERKALADTISISTNNGDLFATLIYKKGGAGLEMHEGQFYLYGQHFDDSFMNHFLSLSQYQGGNFSFAIKGSLDSFKGVARVDNSRIKDYVLLNNVLAFVNTIPSLASFALPSYAQEGIKINEAYAAFEYKNDLMYFNAVKFDSGEVDLYGKGQADYLNNSIDISLSLKTHLGKNVSQLPVVGYVLVGDDGTAATTFEITGALNDPKVESALAKDIVIAPFNILKRAITYPFHLYKTLSEDDNTTQIDPTRFVEQ
jgi:hypothetical protein